MGNHATTWTGTGHDREETTKPYEYGDPFNLDLSRTVHNAVRRAGSGVPVKLHPDDFEVIETEALTRSATVLLLDLSLSMPMRDNFVPAKKMAMALHTLITSRFPRDYLGLVGFSEVAREIEPEDLPTVSWDYVYGTNLQHGLILARKMLAHQQGTKQIILVTDGEPTAHIVPYDGGLAYDVEFNYPPRARDPGAHAGRGDAVHQGEHHHQHVPARPRPGLWGFVDQLSRINRGPHVRHHPGRAGRLRARRLPQPQDDRAGAGSSGRLIGVPSRCSGPAAGRLGAPRMSRCTLRRRAGYMEHPATNRRVRSNAPRRCRWPDAAGVGSGRTGWQTVQVPATHGPRPCAPTVAAPHPGLFFLRFRRLWGRITYL